MKKVKVKLVLLCCLLSSLSLLFVNPFLILYNYNADLNFYPVARGQETPSYNMIVQVLEMNFSASYWAIGSLAANDLCDTIMLTQNSIEAEGWSLTDLETLIAYANSLAKYIILVPYNYTAWTGEATNSLYVTPAQFKTWQTLYPYLSGVFFPEVYGHQIEHSGYSDNSSGTILNQIDAETEVYENMTTLYNMTGFRAEGAKIYAGDNSLSYLTAKALNYSDTYMVKLFNSANNEVMIGQGRGMSKSFNISTWGTTIDLWGELPNGSQRCPAPILTSLEANKALYESWFYGATTFHWEQGSMFGSWTDGLMPNSGNILLDTDGNLTDYGLVVQNFYTFLKHPNSTGKVQTDSKIAIMLGQGGYGGRGPDWGIGILNRTAHTQAQAWVQFSLFNYFFPNISDGSLVVDAWTYVASSLSKHFTGLPYGMVDIISIYATNETLDDYSIVLGLGWSCLNSTIVDHINAYVSRNGTFLAFATFLNSNPDILLGDLENGDSFLGNELFNNTFGCYINPASIAGDKAHVSVNFTANTDFYAYFGESYGFTSQWTWQFNIYTNISSQTKLLATYDNSVYPGTGFILTPNATIIETKLGNGTIYLINAREDSLWTPNNVYGPVIGDFINRLCNYTVASVDNLQYFGSQCLLHYNQTGYYALVFHDNNTETYNLNIHLIDPGTSSLTGVYDLLSGQTYSFISANGVDLYLTLTLEENDGYLFILVSPAYFLPVRLGLGLVGFGLLFICPIMMVKKVQDKEYEKALFPWFIALILGGALIVGWLFPLGYG